MIIDGELKENKIYIDNGFYFGEGLFETMLIYNNRILFLREHIDRINEGLKTIGIDKKIEEKEVINALKELKFKDGVLKLVVSEKNNIFTWRKNNYTKAMYDNGFKLKMSSLRRNKDSIVTYLKSLNYLDNMSEHRKCKEEGYDEVLFLNSDNEIAEGSVSNIFFIKDNTIYTPNVNCGLLDGTIRKYILKNYSVVEGKFSKDKLLEADEIFLTNSIMGIMPVYKFENRIFKEKKLTCDIMSYYKFYIEHTE